ncbi:AKA14 protein, partial [Polyodon spathula]|nr:AKA14 protein [Polyodon spathula]
MGCTPSKPPSAYQHGRAIRDSDTCSTILPSLKSSCSTPLCSTASHNAEAPRQPFLRGYLCTGCFQNTWECHRSWLYCIDFLQEKELEFSRQYHYSFPVEVYCLVESNQLINRLGLTRFREQWLKDVIQSKILLQESVNF